MTHSHLVVCHPENEKMIEKKLSKNCGSCAEGSNNIPKAMHFDNLATEIISSVCLTYCLLAWRRSYAGVRWLLNDFQGEQVASSHVLISFCLESIYWWTHGEDEWGKMVVLHQTIIFHLIFKTLLFFRYIALSYVKQVMVKYQFWVNLGCRTDDNRTQFTGATSRESPSRSCCIKTKVGMGVN